MLRCSARRLAATRTGTRRRLGIALRPPLRLALTPARRGTHRCFPALGQLLQHRCLATQRTDDESQHLIYESDQSFKFKALSAFGGVYATCWLGYVAADAFLIDPTGAIASNSGIVGFIGVSSVACGAFVVRTLAAKTVGRLVIDSAAPAAPTLRVTTYGPAGGERVDEAPLVDIIPRSAPSDTSRLKTFCLPDDETRAYLVLVDPGSVKDPESFSRVVSGVAPAGEGDDRQIRRRRRRRKRRG